MQYANQGDAAIAATPPYRRIFRNGKKWIASAAVLAVTLVGAVAVTDAVTNPSSDQPVAAVEGSLLEEATPIHIAEPGITTPYFGYSGELFPEAAAPVDPQFSGDAITRMLVSRGLLPAAAAPSDPADDALARYLANPGL